MFDLTKDSPIKEVMSYIYDFVSKYGFNDGSFILEEEEEIAEHLCHRLVEAIGVIENTWQPTISRGHIFYLRFKNLQTGESVQYYDMHEREKRKLEKRFGELD
jgi:hypothetical protein